MSYNIHLQVSSGCLNLFDISDNQLKMVLNSYLLGKDKVTLSGETCYFGNDVAIFRVFKNNSGLSREQLKELEVEKGNGESYFNGNYFIPSQLKEFGIEISDEIVGDHSFGCEIKDVLIENDNFINHSRIKELVDLNEKCKYDLSKLITFCKEINSNYIHHNYYSVALLLRTLLNHVPPAFNGKDSFDQVLAELNGPKHKTKREILSRLHELQRKFADMVTHEKLKEFEPEMTLQQVSFKPEVDYLLQEVIIELRKK